MFAYIGFETTIKLTEEAINPDRDIPLALTSALITAIVLYIAVSMVTTNVLSRNTMINTATPVAKLLENCSLHPLIIYTI